MFPHHKPQISTIKGDQQAFLPVDGLTATDTKCAASVPLLVPCEAVDHRVTVPEVLCVLFGLECLLQKKSRIHMNMNTDQF